LEAAAMAVVAGVAVAMGYFNLFTLIWKCG